MHKNIQITGRVQAVGFRMSSKLQADSLGIKGLVTNKENGSVYIEAEGEEVDLQNFIDWCHRGPSYAQVVKVVVEIGESKGFESFEII